MDSAKALVLFDKKILLLLRDDIPTISNPNTWSLIGGIVEKGESFEQTIRREMQKEIGISPQELHYVGCLEIPNGTAHGIFVAYPTKSEVKKITLGNEGQKLAFFSFGEIAGLNLGKEMSLYFQAHHDEIRNIIEQGVHPNPIKLGLR